MVGANHAVRARQRIDGRPSTRAREAGPKSALGQRRSEVLQLLRSCAEPLGVATTADRMGLHPNTARFHLDALVAAGLARRTMEPRGTPGRPRAFYRAIPTTEAELERAGAALLADILAGSWMHWVPQPEQAAVSCGQEWGRYLTERRAPYESIDELAARARLLTILEELGFDPVAERSQEGDRLVLRSCPFLDLALTYPQVVCGVHLGLMRGIVAELDAPLAVTRLEPLAGADGCHAWLSTVQESARSVHHPQESP